MKDLLQTIDLSYNEEVEEKGEEREEGEEEVGQTCLFFLWRISSFFLLRCGHFTAARWAR